MYGVELPITLQQPDLLTILVVLIPILIMAIFLWKIETIFPVKPIEDKL